MTPPNGSRVDRGSKLISARPQTIYEALLDAEAVAQWRPPTGMTGEIAFFDSRVGGRYRMTLHYNDASHDVAGKSSKDADVVNGEFLELVPNEKMVESINFESDDPAFRKPMIITTTLRAAGEMTEVTIECTDVPAAIKAADHAAGIRSTLENLAKYVER